MLREVEADLSRRHPGLRITADQLTSRPGSALPVAAREPELLVLGSQRLGRAAGPLLGSVALAVLGRAERPVVLVPDGANAGDRRVQENPETACETAPCRDVVLGLDRGEFHDAVVEFAFEAAGRRAAALRIVHGWKEPSSRSGSAGAADEQVPEAEEQLTDILRPWRDKFPGVEVIEEAVVGQAGSHLADVARDASLLVIGHKHRGGALGALVGPVTHAVLRGAAAPVAVVPHD